MNQKIDSVVLTSDRECLQHQTVLDLVQKLCTALERENVLYCHWKSNIDLDRSANGENDLDLLVARADAQSFRKVLCDLNFKEAKPLSRQQIPGILHYYGYDIYSDKFVHVHAHFQLVIGHDLTKNYHLPLERPFLESSVQTDLFRVPAAEFELIIFIIRMVLKFSLLDIRPGRQISLSPVLRRELAYLQEKSDPSRMSEILGQHLPYIDKDLINTCIHSLDGESSIWVRMKAKKQLQKEIAGYARRSRITDTALKLLRRVTGLILWKVFGYSPRKRMANGGAIIALVGGDGSGKSTAVYGLHAWLSNKFDTIKVHMGKPPRSLITVVFDSILQFGSLLKKFSMSSFRSSKGIEPELLSGHDQLRTYETKDHSSFTGCLRLVRSVCTTRDRYKAYIKACRFATSGGLVVCDRYPLSQIKLMDRLKFSQFENLTQVNPVIGFLVKTAESYQKKIMLPELMVVLKVPPEIAVKRKTDEEKTYVEMRSREIWDLDWQQTGACVIDASQSREEVLSALKNHIWFNFN